MTGGVKFCTLLVDGESVIAERRRACSEGCAAAAAVAACVVNRSGAPPAIGSQVTSPPQNRYPSPSSARRLPSVVAVSLYVTGTSRNFLLPCGDQIIIR